MLGKIDAQHTVIIANGSSGSGGSIERANAMSQRLGVRVMPFIELSTKSTAEQQKLFEEITQVLVFGGDGSVLYIARLLQLLPDSHRRGIVALGGGGEDVVARQMGTGKQDDLIGAAILDGTLQHQSALVAQVLLNTGSDVPFFWGVMAGLSSDVLGHIEQLRHKGIGDVPRRYVGGALGLFRTLRTGTVRMQRIGETWRQLADVGVLLNTFPNWTSKVLLPITSGAVGLLHTAQTPDALGMSNLMYKVLLLYETTCLMRQISHTPTILRHEPVYAGDVVRIESERGKVAVDSEVLAAHRVEVRMEHLRAKDRVLWGRLD